MKNIRLDKFVSEAAGLTRSQAKTALARGNVSVNGECVRDGSVKVSQDTDEISLDGRRLNARGQVCYLLNKPAGVISATTDDRQKTVLDLLEGENRKNLFPIGRLDIDTEGLLIITNDGELSHRLLSPKKHVDKVYLVKTDTEILCEDMERMRQGMELGDFTALPAEIEKTGENEYLITIREGKFHQVKRMFQAAGARVLYLKRIKFGGLSLDENLKPGEYRQLGEEEIRLLFGENR